MRTQIRVAGILIADGAVVMENALGSDLWNLPGGRLEEAETLRLAVRREFQEEMGLAVACEDMLFVHENFFPLGGDIMREYGFYFRVSGLDANASPRQALASREARFRYEWIALDQLHEINFQPVVLIQHLVDPPPALLYLETRDATLLGDR
ncbi:MAG: NUDIX domain-containing protein [Alphaproteobacteria bacterium]|nr:NUDIX domain-containing protein [Alphaproteobacteria bacterium]